MTDALVRAVSLTRTFGEVVAVDGIDLEVARGDLFGFLGPNGAGKTTTLRLLTGLLHPTSGDAFVAGHSLTHEPAKARAALGFVPDTPYLYDKLTAREFLAFSAALHGVDEDVAERRGRALLALLELEAAADGLVEGYSHGMRQKTALAGALIHDPQVLFLDEPTIGLDPRSARTIKDRCAGCATGEGRVPLDPRARDRRTAVRPGRDPLRGPARGGGDGGGAQGAGAVERVARGDLPGPDRGHRGRRPRGLSRGVPRESGSAP